MVPATVSTVPEGQPTARVGSGEILRNKTLGHPGCSPRRGGCDGIGGWPSLGHKGYSTGTPRQPPTHTLTRLEAA